MSFCLGGVASDTWVSRVFAPFAILGFLFGAVVLPLVMWVNNYPTSGILAVGYAVIAVMGFYLLSRSAAIAVAIVIVVAGQWWLDSVSDTPWQTWQMPVFVALVMVAAGYPIARLMQQFSDLNADLEGEGGRAGGGDGAARTVAAVLVVPVAEAVLTSSDDRP